MREQRILTMRFYGNMTQAEIGERLGISQMHVSRLLVPEQAVAQVPQRLPARGRGGGGPARLTEAMACASGVRPGLRG